MIAGGFAWGMSPAWGNSGEPILGERWNAATKVAG
jgi:hypothetical protein